MKTKNKMPSTGFFDGSLAKEMERAERFEKRKSGKTKRELILEQYELDDIDRTLLKHLSQYPNTGYKELGALVNYSLGGIHKKINRPAFQSALQQIKMTTDKHLEEAAKRAAIRLKTLVNHEDPEIAQPYIKMALNPYLNKSTVDLNIAPVIKYKTMIDVDGSLVQDVIKESVPELLEQSSQENNEQ